MPCGPEKGETRQQTPSTSHSRTLEDNLIICLFEHFLLLTNIYLSYISYCHSTNLFRRLSAHPGVVVGARLHAHQVVLVGVRRRCGRGVLLSQLVHQGLEAGLSGVDAAPHLRV